MRHILALLSIVLFSSCVPARQSTHVACEAPRGVPQAKLLLFGEIHGSVEAPALIGRIACSSALNEPTAIGLEVSTTEQEAIDIYLVSDGSEASKDKLLSRPFWQNGNDGRSSVAMADLIEYVRALNQQGVPLTVFAFDAPTSQSRDAALAQGIRDFHSANPSLPIIALMGNIHASQMPIQRGNQEIVTSGVLLQDLEPTSVLIAYRSGTTWACMPDCGIHQVNSKWGNSRELGFVGESPMPGYAIAYVLPGITASPPAVKSLR
ncbi:hypothetical protein ACW7GZ_07655 [Luteimonas sp. A537]